MVSLLQTAIPLPAQPAYPPYLDVDNFEIGEVFLANLCGGQELRVRCVYLRAFGCVVQLHNVNGGQPCRCVWFDETADDSYDNSHVLKFYDVTRLEANLMLTRAR